jgi:hypothetical protein
MIKPESFTALLNDFFEYIVDVPRLKYGDRQSINSLINEEITLLGKYLRDEKKKWHPRIPRARREGE